MIVHFPYAGLRGSTSYVLANKPPSPTLPLTARDGGTQVRCRNVGMMALAYFLLVCLFLFYVLSFTEAQPAVV